jgi:hypothetical protein
MDTHSKVCVRNVSSSAETGPSSDGQPFINNVRDTINEIIENLNPNDIVGRLTRQGRSRRE